MFVSRKIELTHILEAFVREHADLRDYGDGPRLVTILGPGGPAEVPPLEGGGRALARPAELFLEELERLDFRMIDEHLTEER